MYNSLSKTTEPLPILTLKPVYSLTMTVTMYLLCHPWVDQDLNFLLLTLKDNQRVSFVEYYTNICYLVLGAIRFFRAKNILILKQNNVTIPFVRGKKIIIISCDAISRQQQKPNVVKTNRANLNAITRNRINTLWPDKGQHDRCWSKTQASPSLPHTSLTRTHSLARNFFSLSHSFTHTPPHTHTNSQWVRGWRGFPTILAR